MKVEPEKCDADKLLREIADLVVDVLHGRRHSGELLAAIKPYRTDLTREGKAPNGRED